VVGAARGFAGEAEQKVRRDRARNMSKRAKQNQRAICPPRQKPATDATNPAQYNKAVIRKGIEENPLAALLDLPLSQFAVSGIMLRATAVFRRSLAGWVAEFDPSGYRPVCISAMNRLHPSRRDRLVVGESQFD
jgi:hypothetical protein